MWQDDPIRCSPPQLRQQSRLQQRRLTSPRLAVNLKYLRRACSPEALESFERLTDFRLASKENGRVFFLETHHAGVRRPALGKSKTLRPRERNIVQPIRQTCKPVFTVGRECDLLQVIADELIAVRRPRGPAAQTCPKPVPARTPPCTTSTRTSAASAAERQPLTAGSPRVFVPNHLRAVCRCADRSRGRVGQTHTSSHDITPRRRCPYWNG